MPDSVPLRSVHKQATPKPMEAGKGSAGYAGIFHYGDLMDDKFASGRAISVYPELLDL